MPNANDNILTRWQTSLTSVACSPLEFYERVENYLAESEIPNLKFSQVTRNEGGWFSPRRIYLRVRYKKLYFDVSAFVAGNVLTVGWWFHEDLSGITDLFAEIPVLSFFMQRTYRADTYFQVDYIEYFQKTFHETILRLVDELREDTGLPCLPPEARVPVQEEIW